MNQPLTEMEGMVLAQIAREGALTAYEVKEAFRLSPSQFWSGSAGAVYPLMKRMQDRGYVKSKDVSQNKRPRREFSLTAAGKKAMQGWLSDSKRAIDPGYDPLRSRLLFIQLLPENRQRQFLEQVQQQMATIPAPQKAGEIAEKLHGLWLDSRRKWLDRFIRFLGRQ